MRCRIPLGDEGRVRKFRQRRLERAPSEVFIRALFGLYRRMARDYGITASTKPSAAPSRSEIRVRGQSQRPFPRNLH